MSLILRQSTSKIVSFGPFLDKTDGVTEETGLVSALDHASTGIKLSKNGGALTIRHASVTATTYDAYGMYRVTLDTTDTDTVGTLRMAFNEAATCLPVWQDFQVVEEAVFDALLAASAPGYLQPTTAGRTLDVTATGAAGIDWGNVENQTTIVNLANTAIDTVTVVDNVNSTDSIATGGISNASFAADVGSTAYATNIIALAADKAIVNYGALKPTTAGRTLDVTTTGEAGIDWANIGGATSTVNLTGTSIKTATIVETATGDIQSRIPASLVGGRIDANVGAISTDSVAADNAEAFFDGTGYAGTNNVIPLVTTTTTATNVTTVNGLAANVITAASIAADAIGASELAADAVTEIQSGLATAAALTAVKAVTDKLDTAVELDGAVYRYTTNALEQAPSGGGGGVADWTANERTAIRTILGIPASGTTPDVPSAGALKVIDDFLDTEIAAILADTNELQTDWANGGRLDLILDSAASAGDPWSTALPGAYGAGTAGKIIGDNINAPIGTVDTVVDAIKAKTDNLPSDPADASDIAASFSTVNGTLATIAAYIDTEVAAIKAKTDNLPSSPAAVGSAMTLATDAISAAALSAAAVDEILDEVIEDTVTLRQALRNLLALTNKSSRSGSTIYFRDVADLKTRLAITFDSNADRTAVSRDLT